MLSLTDGDPVKPKRGKGARKRKLHRGMARQPTPERVGFDEDEFLRILERKTSIRRSPLRINSTKIVETLNLADVRHVRGSSPITLKKLLVLTTFTPREVYRLYGDHKVKFAGEYRLLKSLTFRCLTELLLIMVLCASGGVVFKVTEGSFENFYKCGVKRVKRDFVDLLWTRSHNLREEDWKSLARNRLKTFEEELHAAHEAGMVDYSGRRAWSFLNGIVYCLTIVTTIGYGHMFPKTTTGRALTIVYALIGIPLFLIALTDFGKLFTRCIKFVWSFVRRLYYTGSCRRVRKQTNFDGIFKGAQSMIRKSLGTEDDEDVPQVFTPSSVHTPGSPTISAFEIDDEFNLPISVALFILVAYIFCGAVIYMVVEKWDFFESFYFVFISMSTIGFGDYVPRHPVFMIGSIVYLVFGLALMSMCINVVQAKLSDTFKEASAKIGATMGLQVDEDGTVSPESVEVPSVHATVVDEVAKTD
ncbi:TWiK family of potassium channels protein 18-like isoform X1 [Cylas formicarius]|uniref:TWiK family of potassium channels protein 18-like isoform X1 n=1 Tax=Cylas formicarius TaxID=197179 RepID=UPI0029585457|nr:TWiK family of potassium channels protein 18-like isoform X1 [Cylas formicarius]